MTDSNLIELVKVCCLEAFACAMTIVSFIPFKRFPKTVEQLLAILALEKP